MRLIWLSGLSSFSAFADLRLACGFALLLAVLWSDLAGLALVR
jgi:hypothetical protein